MEIYRKGGNSKHAGPMWQIKSERDISAAEVPPDEYSVPKQGRLFSPVVQCWEQFS